MDQFDAERFARGPGALSAAAGSADGRVIRLDDEREERRCARDVGTGVVRVTARGSWARAGVRREAELLASLEVGGIAAAPAVLEIGEEGYVREDAPPLRGRRGRRCAREPSPATGERQAQARAREALDALVDGLHERGWVLGAPRGEGLGLRADGTVTVLDLSGLRPEEGTAARIEDRLWVDSVLHDQGRTLRRRVDTQRASGTSDPAAAAPGGREPRDEGDDCARPERSSATLPVPRLPARSARRSPVPIARALMGPAARAGRRVAEVLASPPLRRLALLSAVAVLIAGVALGGAAWWMVPEGSAPAGSTEGSATAAAPRAGPTSGRITDPLSLATDLSQARHRYVTGLSEDPVALPDSVAATADETVRGAYAGLTVEGGEPRVHSAHVVTGPSPRGTARLAVESSIPAHTVIEADGSATAVAASGPATVDLELRWHEGSWRVAEVRPRS